MSRISTILFSLAFPYTCFCQQINYDIQGKIERITNSKNIFLTTGITDGKIDSTSIDENGMFSFKGTLPQAQEAILETDSAKLGSLWIQSGIIKIEVKEVRYDNKLTTLRITNLKGPEDSYLYFYRDEISKRASSFLIVDKRTDIKTFKESNPKLPAHLTPVSSREEGRKRTDSIIFYCIDSVIGIRPTSKVLPHYIRFYSSLIGPVKTASLYNRLSPELQISADGKDIIEYLNQQSALKPGSTLEYFSMNDSNGKLFKLKDVKSEFILLDFWASWCGPCRANHPYLHQAAEKYKGLRIISISLDDDKTEWLEGVEKDKLSWTNISDLKGFEGPLAKRCKIYSIPFSLLLDKNRKIVDLNLNGSALLWALERIISNK